MKSHKCFMAVLTILAFGLATMVPESAAASTTIPTKFRGYYIGSNDIAHIAKRTMQLGMPQKNLWHYHITKVTKYGHRYSLAINVDHVRVNGLFSLSKSGHHKLAIGNFGLVHKVTKAHYLHCAGKVTHKY